MKGFDRSKWLIAIHHEVRIGPPYGAHWHRFSRPRGNYPDWYCPYCNLSETETDRMLDHVMSAHGDDPELVQTMIVIRAADADRMSCDPEGKPS